MSTTAKVILYKSKTLSNGEHPIMLRITKNRKTSYKSIGHSCTLSLWDEKENLPKKKHPDYKSIVALIDKKKREASKLLLKLDNEGLEYSADTIQKKLKRNQTNITLLNYFKENIEGLENKGRIGYANIFTSTKNSFKKFLKEKDINFNELTLSLLLKYEEYLNEKGNSLNTQFVFLRTLKTLVNYAHKEELIGADFNPFKDFSFKKFRNIKTKKRALTKDQILKIKNLEILENIRLFDSRNYFLFSYYNSGMNFIDLAHLKWEQIDKNNYLTYTRKKTGQDFKFKLLQPAIEILEYYKQIKGNSDKDYVFQILNESHNTPKSIDNRIDKILKTVNADLKIIGKLAEIEEPLTTYVARHSAATIMKRSGVSQSIISETLGHTSEKTTRIYLDSFEDDILYEAAKVLI